MHHDYKNGFDKIRLTPDDVDHSPDEIDNELSGFAPLIGFSFFDKRYSVDDITDLIDNKNDVSSSGEINVNVTKLSQYI